MTNVMGVGTKGRKLPRGFFEMERGSFSTWVSHKRRQAIARVGRLPPLCMDRR